MADFELRLHCLTLAISHLHKQTNHQAALDTAERFYAFLALAYAGRGVEPGTANKHPDHPTLQ